MIQQDLQNSLRSVHSDVCFIESVSLASSCSSKDLSTGTPTSKGIRQDNAAKYRSGKVHPNSQTRRQESNEKIEIFSMRPKNFSASGESQKNSSVGPESSHSGSSQRKYLLGSSLSNLYGQNNDDDELLQTSIVCSGSLGDLCLDDDDISFSDYDLADESLSESIAPLEQETELKELPFERSLHESITSTHRSVSTSSNASKRMLNKGKNRHDGYPQAELLEDTQLPFARKKTIPSKNMKQSNVFELDKQKRSDLLRRSKIPECSQATSKTNHSLGLNEEGSDKEISLGDLLSGQEPRWQESDTRETDLAGKTSPIGRLENGQFLKSSKEIINTSEFLQNNRSKSQATTPATEATWERRVDIPSVQKWKQIEEDMLNVAIRRSLEEV